MQQKKNTTCKQALYRRPNELHAHMSRAHSPNRIWIHSKNQYSLTCKGIPQVYDAISFTSQNERIKKMNS